MSRRSACAAFTKATVFFYICGVVGWKISGVPFGHKDDNSPSAAQQALRGN
jgi:hypothetical protein